MSNYSTDFDEFAVGSYDENNMLPGWEIGTWPGQANGVPGFVLDIVDGSAFPQDTNGFGDWRGNLLAGYYTGNPSNEFSIHPIGLGYADTMVTEVQGYLTTNETLKKTTILSYQDANGDIYAYGIVEMEPDGTVSVGAYQWTDGAFTILQETPGFGPLTIISGTGNASWDNKSTAPNVVVTVTNGVANLKVYDMTGDGSLVIDHTFTPTIPKSRPGLYLNTSSRKSFYSAATFTVQDATGKYITYDATTGRRTESKAINTSAGTGDGGKLVSLNGAGLIDNTMLPPEALAQDAMEITAGEAISAGDLVQIKSDGLAYRAVAQEGQGAMAFSKTAATTGEPVTIYFEGLVEPLTGIAPGTRYYTSDVAGKAVTDASTFDLNQYIGRGASDTQISFEPSVGVVVRETAPVPPDPETTITETEGFEAPEFPLGALV